MAEFDVYRSVGPNVDVSLFGDAAARGAALGQAIPSAGTSIIRGAQEGYQYGQQVRARDLENQQRQHEIDQQPVNDALRQAQLQNAQAIAQINGLKADIDQQTQDLQLQDTQAQLINRRDALQFETQQRKQYTDFTAQFKAASPKQQAQMVLGGQYTDLFANNPKLHNTYLQSVWQNPNNGIPEEERNRLGQSLKIRGLKDYYTDFINKNQKQISDAQQAVLIDPLTNALKDSQELSGFTVDQYPQAVKFIQAGTYAIDPKTKRVIPNEDGTPRIIPEADRDPATKDRYDVFSLDNKLLVSGANDMAGVTSKGFQVYGNAQKWNSFLNGDEEKAAIQQLLAPKQQGSQGGPVGDISLFGQQPQPQATQAPVSTNPITERFRSSLNLGEPELKAIEVPLQSLERQVSAYTRSADYRTSAIGQQKLSETVTSIAKGISNSQFESNPVIKNAYTAADVEAYNAALYRKLSASSTAVLAIANNPLTASSRIDPLYEAYKVSSPSDLYFATQQQQLESTITKLFNASVRNAQQVAEHPVNLQISKNKNDAMLLSKTGKFVSKVGNGQR